MLKSLRSRAGMNEAVEFETLPTVFAADFADGFCGFGCLLD